MNKTEQPMHNSSKSDTKPEVLEPAEQPMQNSSKSDATNRQLARKSQEIRTKFTFHAHIVEYILKEGLDLSHLCNLLLLFLILLLPTHQ